MRKKNSGRLSHSAAVFTREVSGMWGMKWIPLSQVGRAKVKRCPPKPTFLNRMVGNQNTLATLTWLGYHKVVIGYGSILASLLNNTAFSTLACAISKRSNGSLW